MEAPIESLKPMPLAFRKSAAGREPVREWLNRLPREDQRVLGRDIARVQFGRPVGLPVCRPMGIGIWEVRSTLTSRREARMLFGFHDGTLIALTTLIKKTRATPGGEIALAEQRLKEVTKA